jgi:ATP-dependent exoDNAse (exonuclease V) alpha subunit
VAAGIVDAVIASRPTLSDEQRRVVRALCLAGDGVAVVAGRAGTGKTFTLGAAREAWQEAGLPVLGVAIARRAANELWEGAGIRSTSVAALLGGLRNGEWLAERSVLVVDEAGMAPTRALAELLEHVQRAGGKLVLVGDDRQLPAIDAGGVFRGLIQRGLGVELGENVRQTNIWERQALDHLRAGRAEQALRLYDDHQAVLVEPTAAEARERLVRDWFEARGSGDSVMIAQRRADVGELNTLARARMREHGLLGPVEVELGGGGFAVGDQVVVKRNELRLGVMNGQRGEVVAVEPASGLIRIDVGGRQVDLDRRFLSGRTRDGEPTLLHGYAMTGHVAQGATVDRAFVLASEGMSREWAYVALSRGRHANRLYLAAQPDDPRTEFAPSSPELRDPIARLTTTLSQSDAQVLAIDSGRVEAHERHIEAQRAAAAATRARQAVEERGRLWLPGRRRALASAREHERSAHESLGKARQVETQLLHGTRRTAVESDRERDDRWQRAHDRATERVLQRDGGIGREL